MPLPLYGIVSRVAKMHVYVGTTDTRCLAKLLDGLDRITEAGL